MIKLKAKNDTERRVLNYLSSNDTAMKVKNA